MAKRARPTSNVDAAETTLNALDCAGRLERVDAARVQAVRSIAAALDDDPRSPQLWREYRELIKELTGDRDDGGADQLIDELSSPVRHQT
jgi:hypothetical protein